MLFRDLGARAETPGEDSQIVEMHVFARATEEADFPIELRVVPYGAASAGGAVLYPEREDGTVESIQAEWLVSAEAQITPSVQRSKAMRQATSTTHRAA